MGTYSPNYNLFLTAEQDEVDVLLNITNNFSALDTVIKNLDLTSAANLLAHEADTTNIHGIVDTADLVTKSGTQTIGGAKTFTNTLTMAQGIAIQNGSDANEKMWFSGTGLRVTGSANDIVLQVRGAASHTGNLQEWQTSAGAVLARVEATGLFAVGATTTSYIFNTGVGASARFWAHAADKVALQVRAFTGQSVNLQEWNDATNNNLSRIDSSGQFYGTAYLNSGSRVQGTNTILFDVHSTNANTRRIRIQMDDVTPLATIAATYGSGGAFPLAVLLGGSEVARFQPATTGPAFTVAPTSASGVVLVAKGFASQSADLTQWQDSAGTVRLKVRADGWVENTVDMVGFMVSGGGKFMKHDGGAGTQINGNGQLILIKNTGGSGLSLDSLGGPVTWGGTPPSRWGGSTTMIIQSDTGGGIVPLTVKGQTSQSVDLSQWQNSAGTVMATVGTDGRFTTTSYFLAANIQIGASVVGSNTIDTFSGNQLALKAAGVSGLLVRSDQIGFSQPIRSIGQNPAGVPITVKGEAAQTADLQQWQDSAAAVLSRVTAAGATLIGVAAIGGISAASASPLVEVNAPIRSDRVGVATQYVEIAGGGVSNNLALIANGANKTLNIRNTSTAGSNTAGFGIVFEIDDTAASGGVKQAAGVNSQGIFYAGAISSVVATGASVNSALFGTPQTNDALANVQVTSRAATNRPLVVQGFVSQTGSLTEWQSNTGSVLSKVDANGCMVLNNNNSTSGFQVGSVGLNRMMYLGYLSGTDPVYGTSNRYFIGGTAAYPLIFQAGGGVGISHTSAAVAAFVVKAATSQTADLQQWQDSAGTVLAHVRSDGRISAASGSIGVPGFNFEGDTDTGFYSPSADYCRFVAGGVAIQSFRNLGGVIQQGFFGLNPIAQPAGIADAAHSAGGAAPTVPEFDALVDKFNALLANMEALGLQAVL